MSETIPGADSGQPGAPAPVPPSRRPLPMVIAVLVAVAILGGLAVVLLSDGDTSVSANEGSNNSTADDFGQAAPEVTFTYFNGGEGSFSDFGGKPTVVNFFASWCGPCVLEMPDIEAAFQTYGDEVNFVGLNTQEQIENGRRIADELGVTYALASDADGTVYAAFSGFGMPTTVFLDADGTIIEMHTGLILAETLTEKIEQELLS